MNLTTASRTIVTAVIVGGALSGCATQSGSPTEDPAVGENASASDEAESVDDVVEEPVPDNLAFGDTFAFENGVEVTVGDPAEASVGEYAAMMEQWPAYVAFEITIVNGSDANYDPAEFYTTMQSGDAEAEEIFDSEGGFNGSPMTKVLPGRQATFKIGYGVQDASDLVLEVAPGFEYESTIFTNQSS